MWTTNPEEAQGVQCLGPLGRAVDTARGLFCAGDVSDIPSSPESSGALLCAFPPRCQAVTSDPAHRTQPLISFQASQPPGSPQGRHRLFPSHLRWNLGSLPLRASSTPRQPGLVVLRSACTPCTPASPSCPVTAAAEFRSQSPVAEILRRLSQLVSSPQTSFSFSSSHTSLSDS